MKDYVLELDKPRELRFGFKALRMIRTKFGNKTVDQLMQMEIDEIPKLAFCGLQWEDKTLSVEKVEDLLDDAVPKKYTIMAIIELVMNALAAQMGVKVASKKGKADGKKTEEKKEVTETIPSTKKPKKLASA